MQNHRFVFRLTVFSIFAIFISNQLIGQSAKELSELYENQQLLVLKKHLDNNQIYSADWKMFVNALFEPNADSALDMFATVYKTSSDKKLKEYVTERIAEYYYARGYYKTSERILEDKRFLNETVEKKDNERIQSTGSSFGIQIGAFSSYDNAAKKKDELMKKFEDVTIINKKSKSQTLYVVVVGNYSNREAAEKGLQVIKRKTNVNGFIIQY